MYSFLPFSFDYLESSQVLISNICGEFIVVTISSFEKLVNYELSPQSEVYCQCISKNIIFDSDSCYRWAVKSLKRKLIRKKSYLQYPSSLFIIVLTTRCSQSCSYCHASSIPDVGSDEKIDMSIETLEKALNIAFQSPSPELKIEFQGGESLLVFSLIQRAVEIGNDLAITTGKKVEYVVCTNLTMMSPAHLEYFMRNRIELSTSLDGPENLHDKNRRFCSGKGTHQVVREKLAQISEKGYLEHIGALLTVTRDKLPYPKEIVDEYVSSGFSEIFVRDLNWYGYALDESRTEFYSVERFIKFYRELVEYCVELNQSGIFIVESLTELYLTKMYSPWEGGLIDLLSPTGYVCSCLVVDYNGVVYPSDEARMVAREGDGSHALGTVDSTYKELTTSPKARSIVADSLLEAHPVCNKCAFMPFCGANPIDNFRNNHQYYSLWPSERHCRKTKAIVSFIIEKMHNADDGEREVFLSWIGRNSVREFEGIA